ncbi:phosphatase PAP2 family protein [Geomesophilobacter sediminis]|uniref:Phosphatase PAP2 family protein n=1 Tax=Geomesophilobacter sediminis TaxID=2798584 RepID=A0A8J7LXZ1_9BACT|nr:phosphatase PAP2 family protein [Geomesophilobacter sediminis]MBJ6723961.1 phosphatase PAP2 family protein [Geomesophilobacter sediminis]
MHKKWVAGLVLVVSTMSVTLPAGADSGTSPSLPAGTAAPATLAPPQENTVTPQPPEGPAPFSGKQKGAYGLDDAIPPDLKPQPDSDRINGKYLMGYLSDAGKILSAPAHFDRYDWLKVAAVGGVAGSLFLIDGKVKNFAQSHQNAVANKFATVGNDLGNPLFTLPPLGAFYLYGMLNDDVKARRTSLLALESFVISGAITDGIKILAQRHRPNTGDSPYTFDGPKLGLNNLSFASGHTTSAFSIATVIANQYADNPYVPPIAYGLATLTGLSRIYSNAHWASDTFVGGAIGYFVGKAVLSFHKEKSTPNRLTLMPSLSKEMTGMTMQYSF